MKFIFVILFLVLPNFCIGGSFEDCVNHSYLDLVLKIQDCGIQGPLAKELAQYALVRQAHEDGLDRPKHYSVPGISAGGWNEDILKTTLKRMKCGIPVTHCYDSEGMKMFVLQGEGANVASAVTIAFLFDYYVTKFPQAFTEAQRDAWWKSRTYSYLLSCHPTLKEYQEAYDSLYGERQKILQRCNGMYGPGQERIVGEVKRLQPVFKNLEGE
jgi:hypothetical protein